MPLATTEMSLIEAVLLRSGSVAVRVPEAVREEFVSLIPAAAESPCSSVSDGGVFSPVMVMVAVLSVVVVPSLTL